MTPLQRLAGRARQLVRLGDFQPSAKGTLLPNSFFALPTETLNGAVVTRVLEARVQPPYTASHGLDPSTGAGLGVWQLPSGDFPYVNVRLTAVEYNPHIEAFQASI